MKLIGKNILACALGAGLLTFAAGSAQAFVIDNELAVPLDAQLFIKWTDDNGKLQKARITSKDLVNAIGEDFDENVSGDQIVNVGSSDVDCELIDKHGDLVLDLSDDGVIVINHSQLSESEKDGSNGKFKEVSTGTVDVEFYSDGDQVDLDNNTLELIDDVSPYTLTVTGSAINHNDKQQITIAEKDELGAEGHDFDATEDFDDLPIFGIMTGNGSGTIVDAP
jgi:hypothetical protein